MVGPLRGGGVTPPPTTKQKTTFFSINGENSPGSCIMKILFYEVGQLVQIFSSVHPILSVRKQYLLKKNPTWTTKPLGGGVKSLVVRPLKKPLFLCVSSLMQSIFLLDRIQAIKKWVWTTRFWGSDLSSSTTQKKSLFLCIPSKFLLLLTWFFCLCREGRIVCQGSCKQVLQEFPSLTPKDASAANQG